MGEMLTRQMILTPAAGKALIAETLVQRPDVRKAALEHTVVVITGTTDREVGMALLRLVGEEDNLSGFYRGVLKSAAAVLPPAAGEDLVICGGKRLRGKTVYDMASSMKEGDIIFKGINAVNLKERTGAILIGNPEGGTIVPSIQAFVGRRCGLIHPVGVEKRVECSVAELVSEADAPGVPGPRLAPAPGEIYTELDAFRDLGAEKAEIMASGGIGGMEGACVFLIKADTEHMKNIEAAYKRVKDRPLFAETF